METKNELIKIHEVEDTPFCLIEEKTGVKIVMGNAIMSHKIFKSKDEATKYIQKKTWELIIPTAAIVAKKVYEDIRNLKK